MNNQDDFIVECTAAMKEIYKQQICVVTLDPCGEDIAS